MHNIERRWQGALKFQGFNHIQVILVHNKWRFSKWLHLSWSLGCNAKLPYNTLPPKLNGILRIWWLRGSITNASRKPSVLFLDYNFSFYHFRSFFLRFCSDFFFYLMLWFSDFTGLRGDSPLSHSLGASLLHLNINFFQFHLIGDGGRAELSLAGSNFSDGVAKQASSSQAIVIQPDECNHFWLEFQNQGQRSGSSSVNGSIALGWWVVP